MSSQRLNRNLLLAAAVLLAQEDKPMARDSATYRAAERTLNKLNYASPLLWWRKGLGLSRREADRFRVAMLRGDTEQEAMAYAMAIRQDTT